MQITLNNHFRPKERDVIFAKCYEEGDEIIGITQDHSGSGVKFKKSEVDEVFSDGYVWLTLKQYEDIYGN